jgi:hypothetical protein
MDPGEAGPTIDPRSPGVVPGSVVRETVRPDEPMTAELTEGTYWVVSSNGGTVVLSACTDVEITDVRPRPRAPVRPSLPVTSEHRPRDAARIARPLSARVPAWHSGAMFSSCTIIIA